MEGIKGKNRAFSAKDLAAKQKQISIGEFFEKNKHFLGFDTPQRSLITAVKEGVDNSLDACEEARILPKISVKIEKCEEDKENILLTIRDNGPGIPKSAIENVFGKLLFGSRFHAVRQSRGQQGIGITGVVMYSQLTTGKPVLITTKIASEATAMRTEISLDTKRNKAITHGFDRIIWVDEDGTQIDHGVEIIAQMKGKYIRGKQSVQAYLKGTAIVNPHADITFIEPNKNMFRWPSVTDHLPRQVIEIRPHPHGLELGQMMRMAEETSEKAMKGFLRREFSGVSTRAAERVCDAAGIKRTTTPKRIDMKGIGKLLDALKMEKLSPPAVNCLSPIEGLLIKKGLAKAIDSRFSATLTRPPQVSNGNPFQIEVGLVFGGDLPRDGQVQILRFANRVPLLYQQGGCLLTQIVESVDWRQYGLEQRGGKGIPHGPAAVLVHLASTNVQFTSEAKEAVADSGEVRAEGRKALLELGRGLRTHLKRKARMAKSREKFELVNEILPLIAEKTENILGREKLDLGPVITRIMNAVFCELNTDFDLNSGELSISILVKNHTEKVRSHSFLCSIPFGSPVELVEESRVGYDEVPGLRAWALQDIGAGEDYCLNMRFKGCEKGDMRGVEVHHRGKGEIIGSELIDEQILASMKMDHEQSLLADSDDGQSSLMEWGENE